MPAPSSRYLRLGVALLSASITSGGGGLSAAMRAGSGTRAALGAVPAIGTTRAVQTWRLPRSSSNMSKAKSYLLFPVFGVL